MTVWFQWLSFIFCAFVVPPLVLAVIRKTKARLQNRMGPSFLQPFFDLLKLLRKNETVSETVSWIFRSTAALNAALMLVIALFVPWITFKPVMAGCDFFLVLYLFAAARFFSILYAFDSGSAFSAFGASREATLSILIEPASMLNFAALGVLAGTSDLVRIFQYGGSDILAANPGLWILVGTGILLASLVELSRMPIDDPTTHLELTMVHEAMILEASGKNLALIEYGHALRMSVLFGLTAQCYFHAVPFAYRLDEVGLGVLSVFGIFLIALLVALYEGLAVKLRWRKAPEFIAYSLTMSLLACFIAVGGGVLR